MMSVVTTDLYSAQELLDVEPVTVTYSGGEVPINTGRPVLHAVRGDVMEALCSSATGRLLPTGWAWSDEVPEHIRRCAVCLGLFPIIRT